MGRGEKRVGWVVVEGGGVGVSQGVGNGWEFGGWPHSGGAALKAAQPAKRARIKVDSR